MSTLAGKARRLVLRDQSRGGHLRIMKPELTPLSSIRKAGRPLILGSTSTASRRSDDRADLAQRHGEDVGGEGDRLGVEIAAGQRLVAEQQRIVGDRIGLDLQRPRGVADQVERRAHHLRLAAEAVGVLHPVAIVMAVADRAARQQAAQHGGDVDLPGLAARGVDARIERRRRCPSARRSTARRRRAPRRTRARR